MPACRSSSSGRDIAVIKRGCLKRAAYFFKKNDFVFSYCDYDLGVEVSWDRATDMRTTEGLFTNTLELRLIWNNIVYQKGDSLLVDIKRGFNLSIYFNPNDVINFYGFVDMNLARNSVEDKWRIRSWKDMTNP